MSAGAALHALGVIVSTLALSGCMVATATMAAGSVAVAAGSVAVSAATTAGSAVVSGASATARAVLPGKGPDAQHDPEAVASSSVIDVAVVPLMPDDDPNVSAPAPDHETP